MTDPATLGRLDRVESMLEIQRLAVRYAMAIDARDIDTWLSLFPEDIDCGRRGRGREALRSFIAPAVRDFYRTVHQIVGHTVDVLEGDHAEGRVYCRAEHEYGDKWIVQAICYFDRYERRDGRWYFTRRDEDFFYTCDALEHPQDARFQRWPGPPPKHSPGMMMTRYPSWTAFWADATPDELAKITRHPARPEPG
ncbi:MAG TPA: nuclear transport factor 2 family protein [Phenylobacterium sp.]|nr:nuclear transport factor 2 family protein [Phenylobacterium sp.]